MARGETVFTLTPLGPAERDQRIEAERAVASAAAEEEAARQRLQRLELLLKDGAASVRAVEEARAHLQVAAAALGAARERLKVVSQNRIGSRGEIAIEAPLTGVLQMIAAVPGQAVAASAPLFEVAQVETLWIRAPVYAGSVRDFDLTRPVSVTTLGQSGPPMLARPVAAPLKADPTAASVDLFFELADARSAPSDDRTNSVPPRDSTRAQSLRPGERVTVELPLSGAESGLVIPDSALVYDIHGASWVYEELRPGAYARRRVEIARHVGEHVVIARGLTQGQKVVVVGAAELFGTEFGAGK